jgi:prepilin-type N-terminal cleavage/methylation domain-containing protein
MAADTLHRESVFAPRPPRRARPRPLARAFTLLEVLLTAAILGLILPLLLFFVLTLSEIWLEGVQGDFFPQHVDGVSEFLRQALERSEAVVAGGAEGETTLPVEWARPPGFSDLEDPLLMFRQVEAPALFVREGESMPNLYVYLYFDPDDGLSLLWYSSHDEEVEDKRDLWRTPVSPYVTALEYCYYDEDRERWNIVEDPEENDDDAFLLPQFLKLTFEHEGSRYVRNLYLPQRNADVPTF